jgi:hypothetical protein
MREMKGCHVAVCYDFLALWDSLRINHGQSLLKVLSALRERVWHLCDLGYERIHVRKAISSSL